MYSGDRIKELRTINKMTQDELAQKLGLQKSAIAKYENGRVENIKRSTLQKMANIFNVSPAYIMGLSDAKNTSDITFNHIPEELSSSFKEVIAKMQNLNDIDNNDLFTYMSGLDELLTLLSTKVNELYNKHTINNSYKAIDNSEKELLNIYRLLNTDGKSEAIKRVKELTYIPSYVEENQ